MNELTEKELAADVALSVAGIIVAKIALNKAVASIASIMMLIAGKLV